MSEALAKIRASNTFEVKDHGVLYRCQLPDLQECILAGDIPVPVLSQMAKKQADEGDETPSTPAPQSSEALLETQAFKRRLVRAAVYEIDNEPVTLDDDDVRAMHPDDFRRIYRIAARDEDAEGEA